MKRREFVKLALAAPAALLALPAPCKHNALYNGSASGYRTVCIDCGAEFDGKLVGQGSTVFVLEKDRGRGKQISRPHWQELNG